MSDLLSTTKGKVGLGVAAGLLVLVAAWFLVVAPQRSKANELKAQLAASQDELSKRRLALITPSTNVTVKPSDLYRLTKALPNETDMSGILIDVDRLAHRRSLKFTSLTPSTQALGSGFTQQPIAIVVQGRFGNVSAFLGDLRKLVTVRGGRLDARGRLYSVSKVDLSAPDGTTTFPVVKASVMLNAYSFSAAAPTPQAPTTTTPDSSSSSSGTVAAGATP
jgi:Tfp pilus assembly protein PilO